MNGRKLDRIIRMRCITVFAVLLWATLIYGDDPLCNDQLVKTLPDSHLSSSDNRVTPGLTTGPGRGRLNTTEVTASNGTTLEGAWSPSADGQTAYIQAMFDDVTMIDSIMTQGRNQGNEFVKFYTVQYTEDGTTWKTLQNQALGVEQIFQGNSDGDTIQENPLDCPIFAKGIRIVPKEWQGHAAIRFDVKGCNLDDTAAVLTSTTFLPGIVTPFGPTTASMSSTINMQTLINWFKTALSNATTTAIPQTTPAATSKLTTPPYVFHPGIPGNLLPVTVSTLKPATTPIPPFMPGIPHPFATTKKPGFIPSLIG